ncbi:MAG: DNA polymerase/3'-5' exonuclease PolX [Chthoniobacter sp.]|nr:DNA polymerase/3'-5' exonuclease PolX [Chthoniobacter sp.]
MPLHNAEIVDIFTEVADLLEVEGANPFRVRAYRNAVLTLGALPQSLADMVARGDELSGLPGIGKDLAGKIAEIVHTGKLALLEELHARTPPHLRELLRIPGLGPKRVRMLRDDLGIKSVADLKAAAEKRLIREHAGFGEKTERKILEEIARLKAADVRVKWIVAEEVANTLLAHLRALKGIENIEVAGSFRRKKETVGDLDIVVTSAEGVAVMDHCIAFDEVVSVLGRGPTKCSLRLRSGLQVDVRVVPNASFGAALHYFTGSKAHNIAVRKMGVARKLKISEYGVFRGNRRIAGATEAEVYAQVGLPYIEPELREDSGEIRAAQEGRLPKLVTLDDIRGDLHCHTTDSDGSNSLAEMAEAARLLGYEYLAISDHSRRLTMVHGLDARRLGAQIKRIERLNATLRGFTVLKSCEVEILEDGSLDLPDDILKELDLTVCSLHYKLNLPREQQTARILRAMDNPSFRILGHPTGRLINQRPPCDIDMERVMRGAVERGCCLEVNGQPDRLDLSDTYCRMAKEFGVKLAISTDAHRTSDLAFMRLGIAQARRGWLESEDVINTRKLAEMKNLLQRR